MAQVFSAESKFENLKIKSVTIAISFLDTLKLIRVAPGNLDVSVDLIRLL